jgi:LmbE family N-acetylglucosaminyl deacetylase
MKKELPTERYIFLSPHLDDAVFSCGGRIWQAVNQGRRVLVVTVFAAGPPPAVELSPFAQALHRRWGEAHAPEQRRQEDREALRSLGARGLHWPYMDCIYRRGPASAFLYPDEAALWGPVSPQEADLVGELARRITALGSEGRALIHTPLGVGQHVDHRLVRQAAEATGRPLLYYADYPYAEDPQAVARALGGVRWEERRVYLSPAAVRAKGEAMARYRSQISTFWMDRERMERAVRDFSRRVGRGRPAERYWRRVS